ncbi:glycosyltransferase family 2 protein [Plastoroseomonas arctica]|uniref:glycosyltransferase family 2 protein n=1 Tax=Plastoroseomonas arctica TaxID=1509237 RepID=UPI001BAC4342|nr:glycosyltransferase family 2 protein [Plastoroseomonas arctica]
MAGQTRPADAVIICPAHPDDFDERAAASIGLPITAIRSRPGSCAQRNAILDRSSEFNLVVFFDDDFLPANTFLAECERLFAEAPDIVVATGRVLVDGIHGPGLSVAEGRAILERDDGSDAEAPPTAIYNAYGCNMAFRMAAIDANATRFDEAMPLYAWQEDVDFCRRLAPLGRIVRSPALRGVHLGSKRGRSSGIRFGYSQIANPLYLVRKGSVHRSWALRLMLRNLAANMAGSLRPPALVDRRGRLRGNLIAFRDLLRRRMAPDRILEL